MTKVIKDSKFNKEAESIIYKGDCLELLSQIPDKFVKLIVTSPPYNVGKSYEKKIATKDYLNQQTEVIKECVRVLDDNGSICWQVGNYVNKGEIIPLDIILYPIFTSLGLKLRNRIVWHFGHGLHASKRFSGRYEVILWFTKSDEYIFNLDPIRIPQKYPHKKHFKGPNKGKLSGNPKGKNPSDIWEIPNVKAQHVEKTEHPCQFPVELIERLVLSMTNEGDWVFDPYMGVGTTAIAALINRRKSIGAEIIPEYVEIANKRIELAEKGELRIRPMQRSVYDPNKPNNIPPKFVEIRSSRQSKLV
ncbi:MAG: site-specific DNA-methyltransferase [Candidatus Methanofastidiosum sp.]|nr:site-specific DNA-methyltransferase [Methanofastidiosum sp.]